MEISFLVQLDLHEKIVERFSRLLRAFYTIIARKWKTFKHRVPVYCWNVGKCFKTIMSLYASEFLCEIELPSNWFVVFGTNEVQSSGACGCVWSITLKRWIMGRLWSTLWHVCNFVCVLIYDRTRTIDFGKLMWNRDWKIRCLWFTRKNKLALPRACNFLRGGK